MRRINRTAFDRKNYVAAEGPIEQRSVLGTVLRPKETCMMQVLARILSRACDRRYCLRSQIASGHVFLYVASLVHTRPTQGAAEFYADL